MTLGTSNASRQRFRGRGKTYEEVTITREGSSGRAAAARSGVNLYYVIRWEDIVESAVLAMMYVPRTVRGRKSFVLTAEPD